MGVVNGANGEKGYCMAVREAISNMVRLNLTGKLNAAIEEYAPNYLLVPYYDLGTEITYRDVSHQINERLHISQRETLWEKTLSILLKNLDKIS